MVGHLRRLTRRTEGKWSLLQESAGGAQHPLPTKPGNNWAQEFIISVPESPKPSKNVVLLRDMTNDF